MVSFLLSCNRKFIWNEPVLRGHLSNKSTFSLSQKWPLNTDLTVFVLPCSFPVTLSTKDCQTIVWKNKALTKVVQQFWWTLICMFWNKLIFCFNIAAFRSHRAQKVAKQLYEKRGFDEGRAAILIQTYFRMWKCKSIYQQLQQYKSQKELQLIYFTQQVCPVHSF